ncbi:MAG: HAD-IC family P-type ATPase [Gammaproteobacteria bacterium]|nr:HAD-IC family P-type ATPase [Gammaproteobacteria bacterium]MBD3777319.1 HAD-IC family P-type ATPase [Thiotrichales bacterium]
MQHWRWLEPFFWGEFLVAAIISLMYVGGQVLEKYAANRAQRELTALLNRVPSRAEIYRGDGLQSVPVEQVKPGDRLLIKSGMVLPVDGYVAAGKAILDESSLTGEFLPVTLENGQAASSGTLNVGAPFDLIAVHDAADSRYSEVIRLVKEAQESKSSFTRMADRYALWFVPLTLLIAGIAWWYSADPVRALSVLVVATPCPLILAAPIAIVSGISAAAKRGVLLKNGAVLEVLSKVERIIFDKTGILTTRHPRLVEIETDGELSREEVLRLAASLEQLSFHSVSHSIVEEAKQRGLMLAMPLEVEEVAGSGIKGIVNQRAVMIGQPEWVLAGMNPSDWVRKLMERSHNQGIMLILLALDKDVRGVLLLQDEIRFDSPITLRSLRSAGAESLAMASMMRRPWRLPMLGWPLVRAVRVRVRKRPMRS